MEKVLIDTFVVPEESKAAFRERARKVQTFLKTLPGFVEGFIYEKTGGESRYNFLTVAAWKDAKAFENAGKAVEEEFKRQGYNPEETRKRLNIEIVRSSYERSPW